MNEGKKGFRAKKHRVASIEPSKPRNFVAKNMGKATSGAGAHKDKKKALKQGDVKHKKDYAEHLEQQLQNKLVENVQGLSESQLRDISDYKEKRQALYDLELDPTVQRTPELAQAVQQRKIELEKEAKAKGLIEATLHEDGLDPVRRLQIIHMLAKKLDWEVNYLELASDAELVKWYKQVKAGEPVDEASYYNRRDAYQRDYDSSQTGFGRRDREDDEYHVPDPDPEFQRNRQETMMYNVTVDGKAVNEKPMLGRSAALAWAKEQVAAGQLDPKVAKLSPVQYTSEGAKVDRQAMHITKSMMKRHGMSRDEAEAAAWAHIKHPKKKKKKAREGWTHDTLAAQLFEQELTYEDQLNSMLAKKLQK